MANRTLQQLLDAQYPTFAETHALPEYVRDAVHALRSCRTAALGGHVPTALVHVSAVTVWEITIKAQLRRLDPGTDRLDQEITANQFIEPPILAQHALVAGNLPLHHQDPFDRMLIAQAHVENLVVVTHDKIFASSDVAVLRT